MLGLTRESLIYNGAAYRGTPPITAEVLRTKMMPEYSIDTRLPGIIDVVKMQAPNGETVTVGVDANGEVVAAEAKPNWVPLALAAGAALFFLG